MLNNIVDKTVKLYGYSADLGNVVAAMLSGNPELRPSADDVGRLSSVQGWKGSIGFRSGNLSKMGRTIKGRNFMLLGDQLPRGGYEVEEGGGGSCLWKSNLGSEFFGGEPDCNHSKSGGLKSGQMIDTT